METLYPQDPECDTVNISYTQDIQPIFDNNCTMCHTGPTPPAGFSLVDYENAVVVAKSGRLLGAVKHESGYLAMPQGANKLDDCSINKLEAWINLSYPDN
jgi:cytochrome c5